MPSGWEVYYVLILAAILALGIPASLALFARLTRPISASKTQSSVSPSIVDDEKRRSHIEPQMNTRYFYGIGASLLLMSMFLLLIPCVTSGTTPMGALVIIVVSIFALLGLLYSVSKGDLRWLSALTKNKEQS